MKILRGNLTLAAAARKVGGSAAKLSRLENGRQTPKAADIAKLMRAYRAEPEVAAAVAELVTHARATRSHWLYAFRDLVNGDVHRLIALETAAAVLVTYEAKIVPGLIQTPGYYRALFEGELRPSEADQLERRVELRACRQDRFFEDPARSVFYLEESSLYRQIGSPRIMADQIQHIYDLTGRPGFGIRVIRKDHLFASSISSLTHLDFGSGGLRELIYNETLTGGEYFTHGIDERPAEGERYKLSEMEQYKEQLLKLMNVSAERAPSRPLILQALWHWQERL
ncbi:helix-turn-helix domain-containing protein [Kitasatospora griseola]|uniref:helix-turn-helix domain-containing protein n=1 Tax=Kitasatospora griseola TaxID=2064 RepID=UPI003855DD87